MMRVALIGRNAPELCARVLTCVEVGYWLLLLTC